MYQKLIIREAEAHVRWTCCVQNKRQPRKKPLTLAGHSRDDVIRPDRIASFLSIKRTTAEDVAESKRVTDRK